MAFFRSILNAVDEIQCQGCLKKKCMLGVGHKVAFEGLSPSFSP